MNFINSMLKFNKKKKKRSQLRIVLFFIKK